MDDQPLPFHDSFDELLDAFRVAIASVTWLKLSAKEARGFYADKNEIIGLTCSVTEKTIKVGKDILLSIEKEAFEQPGLYNQAMINFYRVFTIAIKDVVWETADFSQHLSKPEFKFLKHIRNASAHNNQFYWGNAAQRVSTLNELPVVWKNKKINQELEGAKLYMHFLQPGDLFYLLADISRLAVTHSHQSQ